MNTDCKKLRQEIDGSTPGRVRSAFATRHISECSDCNAFAGQTVNLQELLSSLGTVEAPGDFHFRLRARLAGEKPAGASFSLSGFTFSLRGVAVAALLLVFGSALFLGLRTPSENLITANNNTEAAVNPGALLGPSRAASKIETTPAPTNNTAAISTPPASKPAVIASNRGNHRTGIREMGSRPAPIIKAADLNASASDFPIDASTQPVRVSLDNGRGNSRTISLPPVSFGSQRVMSQGSTPLLASARGSW